MHLPMKNPGYGPAYDQVTLMFLVSVSVLFGAVFLVETERFVYFGYKHSRI